MVILKTKIFQQSPLILPTILERIIPTTIQTNEQIQTGTIISYVIDAPCDTLIAIIVVGIRLKQAHPRIERVTISFVALLLFLVAFIFSIAERARGVVAFERPKTLALIQAVISSVATFSLKDLGKTCFKIGFNSLDSLAIAPLDFSTSIIPFQNAIKPIIDITTVTLLDAPFKIESHRSFRFPQIKE